MPLKFEMGEAFQLNWCEEGLVVGGIYHRIQVSHMKLCASRGIYDNMKTMVDKVPRGKGGQSSKGRIVKVRFAVMCSHDLFNAYSSDLWTNSHFLWS